MKKEKLTTKKVKAEKKKTQTKQQKKKMNQLNLIKKGEKK
jgi:hypothetical protein